jgi:competence protein ComEC
MRPRNALHAMLLTAALAMLVASGCAAAPTTGTGTGQAASDAAPRSSSPTVRPSTGPKPKPGHSRTTAAKPKAGHTAAKRAGARVTISFVDIGQGDGIVIKAGSWTGLIDGGPAGRDGAIAAELSRLGVVRLSAVLATHPDADHIGDLAAVVQEFRPRLAYSDDVGTTRTYQRFMSAVHAVHARVVSVFRGRKLALGPLTAQVLNPGHDGSDTNADSIVLLLDIDGHRVLLTGDDTPPSEDFVADVCARGPPLYILKVAHHGSRYATSASFLSQTRPRYAVISVGPNSYGHPAPETLRRLRAAHATIYTTQGNGTITVTFLASGAVHWSFSGSSRPFVALKASTPATTTHTQGATGGTIVYVTATGHCYHRAGCRYLARSKIAMTLAQARVQGYRPCSVCDPPR